jgi:hypothetical protein
MLLLVRGVVSLESAAVGAVLPLAALEAGVAQAWQRRKMQAVLRPRGRINAGKLDNGPAIIAGGCGFQLNIKHLAEPAAPKQRASRRGLAVLDGCPQGCAKPMQHIATWIMIAQGSKGACKCAGKNAARRQVPPGGM